MIVTAARPLAREVRVIGLVTSAHFLSHFYQLALPPLFPLMKEEFGIGFLELGVVLTVFSTATGLTQTPVGFLVDRIGARTLLIAGLALLSASIGLVGVMPSFEALLVLAVFGGIANAVFHPADFSILSASVHQSRLGRAFSYHAVSGNLGWAAAPIVMIALAGTLGLRNAFLVAGAVGLVVSLLLLLQFNHLREETAEGEGKAGKGARGGSFRDGLKLILSRPVMMCFLFTLVYSMAFGGIRNFSVAALDILYATPLAVVTTALSGYLIGSSFGNLLGGFAADKTGRPALMFTLNILTISGLTALVGVTALPAALLIAVLVVAGTLQGSLLPVRDLLVRSVAPPGQVGKVFGFVSSGLGLGGAITPAVYGWLMDHGDPRWVFYGSALMMLLALATYVETSRRVVR